MKFSCQSCSTRYNISDEKARGKVLKIRCRKCKAGIVVDGRPLVAKPAEEGSGDDGDTTRMMPAPQLEKALSSVRPQTAASDEGDDQDTTRMMSIADLERERRKAMAGDAPQDENASSQKTPAPASAASAFDDLFRRSADDAMPHENEDETGNEHEHENEDENANANVDVDEDGNENDANQRRDDVENQDANAHEDDEDPRHEPGGWHAVIGRDQRGPFTLDDLQVEIAAGRVTDRTYVWREDMDGWKPARDVAPLAQLFQVGALPSNDAGPADPSSGDRAGFVGDEDVLGDPRPGRDLFAQGDLGEIFEGLPSEEGDGTDRGAASLDAPRTSAASPPASGDSGDDPFSAALDAPPAEDIGESLPLDGDDVDAPPRETTQMFILASGVRKQKSPLRIAAFVVAFLGCLGGLGYLVSVAAGVDLAGLVPVGSDRREALPWESSGGDPDLRDRMLGVRKDEALDDGHTASRRRPRGSGTETETETEGERRVREQREAEKAAVAPEQSAMLADLYGQTERGTVAVRVRGGQDDRGGVDGAAADFDAENLHRRLSENQSAFETCVQQELRRNPRFRGGRVDMTLTIAPSGVVTGAQLADHGLDRSEVGRCLTRSARRMMLQSFPGRHSVDVVVPLMLSASL